MPALLAGLSRWLLQKLGWLAVILAILLAGSWLNEEWRQREQLRKDIETQAAAVAARRQELQGQLRGLDARIARTEREWSTALRKLADVERQAREARRAADAARTRRDTLERESAWWDWLIAQEKIFELEQARARFLALEEVARAWEVARDRVAPRFRESPAVALVAERERAASEVHALEALASAQQERLAQDPREKLLAAVRGQLATALWVLAGVILAPLLLKVLFYFGLAPLAQRLPPIRILAGDRWPEVPPPRPSSVSVPVEIGPDEELLVHPDFVQSSSQPALKRTEWFLNPRLPLSSIASGMFGLTGIRPEGREPTRVVLAARNDPLGEVAVVDLPPGTAMVVQPRSLAGVVHPAETAVRITRHWRLASPHAWLTLQLRYLVFHGPCRLVLKGCRGVRAEQPAPGRPRLINQSATLAFSANLDYRNTRCETFVAYARGRENLFNDLFGGGPGWFIYEEMPAAGRRTGIGGRGIEGVADAMLKAFGI